MYGPRASRMNTGSPPTARNARTGEFTPPGMTRWARSKRTFEFGSLIEGHGSPLRDGASSGFWGGRVTSVTKDGLAIRQANAAFYEAFERLDLDAMSSLWARTVTVTCVHPGWDMVSGYEAVMQSWR